MTVFKKRNLIKEFLFQENKNNTPSYTELSPLRLPSPSDDTLLACFTRWRHSRGATSSLRWTLRVEDFLRRNPILFLWPSIKKHCMLYSNTHTFIAYEVFKQHLNELKRVLSLFFLIIIILSLLLIISEWYLKLKNMLIIFLRVIIHKN